MCTSLLSLSFHRFAGWQLTSTRAKCRQSIHTSYQFLVHIKTIDLLIMQKYARISILLRLWCPSPDLIHLVLYVGVFSPLRWQTWYLWLFLEHLHDTAFSFKFLCEILFPCGLEMDRSSVNAELRPNNSAERSARFGSATCELFGRTLAKIWRHFAVLRLRRFALIWSHCTL